MPFDQQNFDPLPRDPGLRLLIEGRARISDPERWIKNALHRDIPGEPLKMCALGAIHWRWGSANFEGYDSAHAALKAVLPRKYRQGMEACLGVPLFNNATHTTHSDVLALFDRAIAARKAELLETNEIGA